jgi:hypothetical protein
MRNDDIDDAIDVPSPKVLDIEVATLAIGFGMLVTRWEDGRLVGS